MNIKSNCYNNVMSDPPADNSTDATPQDQPVKLYLELTTECNLDCAMCIRHSWEGPGGSMFDDTIEAVLSGLNEAESITQINLSGFGEAMRHPRFWEVLARLKKAGLFVEVISNGFWTDENTAQRLIDLKLDRLIVSLDSITGGSGTMLHPNSFETVSENLNSLHKLRLAGRLEYPQTHIEFVATKKNISELPDLQRLAPVLGFSKILVTNVIPHTPELAGQTLYEDSNITSRARQASPKSVAVDLPIMDPNAEVGRSVQQLSRGGASIMVNGSEILGASARCRFVSEGKLAIRWDGRVSPCLSLMHEYTYHHRGRAKQMRPYHLGDINTTQLIDIWNGVEYADFRRRVRDFEFSPCLDCGDCDLRETNEADCYSDQFPRCGECLWAYGLIQCP